MVSYYLLACMAIFYVSVMSLGREALHAWKPWTILHSLIQQTLNSFLDSALVFSTAMLLASIYRFASTDLNPDGEDNTFIYSLINAITMSMFSVFPPLILQLAARGLRRRRIRVILWFFVIGFTITLIVLFYEWRGPHRISKYFLDEDHTENQMTRHRAPALWLSFCDSNDPRLLDALDSALILAQAVLGINLPGWFYLLLTIKGTHQDSEARYGCVNWGSCRNLPALKRYEKPIRALNIVLCCVTMLLLLGIFTVISEQVARTMGPWGKDRQWSVNQVLALATFAPLVFDLVALLLGKWTPSQLRLSPLLQGYVDSDLN